MIPAPEDWTPSSQILSFLNGMTKPVRLCNLNSKMARIYFSSLFFFCICGHLSPSDAETSKYLKFSNQNETPVDKATNYATLKSGILDELPSARFTICSSIYISFFRGYQSFYNLLKNDHKTLWFSLLIESQDTTKGKYFSFISYYGGFIISNTGGELNLRPHDWSHACTTVDVESGHIMVAINGVLTHNTTITSNHFTNNLPTFFSKNLVIGLCQEKYPGTKTFNYQSEASVTNVNVFSVPMEKSKM